MNTPWKMNADYESVLFYGKIAPQILNQSLETFVLFLEKSPLLSSKKYSSPFLDYVEEITHHKPEIIEKSSKFQNWWGELKDSEQERILNSKITSTELVQNKKWCDRTFLVQKENDINLIPLDRTYLVKNPFGMSGQRFLTINPELPHHDLVIQIKKWLQDGTLVVEPLLNRKLDFSAYVFADDSIIYYENMVDKYYQYKGTIFHNYLKADLNHLSFFDKISVNKWKDYEKQISEITKHYGSLMAINGYSIDSFIYEEENELKIRALSEVNYRRTMGRVTYELAKRFNQSRPWAQLIIGKSALGDGGFLPFKNKMNDLLWNSNKESGFIILTSGDTRFEILFLLASSQLEAQKLQNELLLRFPSYNFSVKIEH